MKIIPAGEFKTHCLSIIDDVRKRRQPVLITKKGVAVAKRAPVESTERDQRILDSALLKTIW